MGEWQPIETAPKDGSYLLLFTADELCVTGFWSDRVENFYKSQKGWASYDPDNAKGDWVSHLTVSDNDRRLYCGWTPKFWMPLPAPPTDRH